MDRTIPSSGTQRTPLQQLATDAGLLVDWEDAASRPMRVADEVLRAVLFTLGLPAGTPTQVSESQARLRAEAEAVAIPPLVTGVVGQPIVLQTSAPQAALLGGQIYRVDFESDGSTEGKISVSASEHHATLRLAPVQAVGYHRLTIDAGPGTVIEATLRYADFAQADEIFSTGNFAKVAPVIRIDQRELKPGPFYTRARKLYWDVAHAVRLAA